MLVVTFLLAWTDNEPGPMITGGTSASLIDHTDLEFISLLCAVLLLKASSVKLAVARQNSRKFPARGVVPVDTVAVQVQSDFIGASVRILYGVTDIPPADVSTTDDNTAIQSIGFAVSTSVSSHEISIETGMMVVPAGTAMYASGLVA